MEQNYAFLLWRTAVNDGIQVGGADNLDLISRQDLQSKTWVRSIKTQRALSTYGFKGWDIVQ
jgi:hypothetical protein